MNNFDDIVKRSFEDQSLDNESWLEPNDSVLSAIHTELNQTKKRKRRFFWAWPIGIIVLIGCTVALLLRPELMDNQVSNQDAKLELIILPSENNNGPKAANAIIKDSNKEDISKIAITNTSQTQETNIKVEDEMNTDTKLVTVSKSSNVVESKETLRMTTPSNINIIPSNVKNAINTALDINININQNLPVVNTQTKTTLTSSIVDENSKIKRILFESNPLDKLPIKSIVPDDNSEKDNPNLALPFIATQALKKKKASIVEFNGGLLFWNDQLNTNYQSALSPADFENGNDYGFQIGLALKKEVISKISAGVRLSYSQIENRSGHNAVLAYEEGQEVNGENNYDNIQLATPYGFVSSKFNIKRSETALEPNATLNSSINSKHRLRIASLESLLAFNVINLQKFSVNVEANLGYNYLIDINNNLDFIDTKHDDFKFTNGEILVDQGNLRNGFWSTGLTVDVNYAFQPNASIGINYGFREALSPLFSSGDFSSSPRTQQVNVVLQRKF